MLAEDFEADKLVFPVLVQPKIDGVRGVVSDAGVLTGRSLKLHGNRYATQRFSEERFAGLDGELTLGTVLNHDDLCRSTRSALASYDGEPDIYFNVFDLIDKHTIMLTYDLSYL